MKLKPLISKLKLDYASPDITDENFPWSEQPKGKVELLNFNERLLTEQVLQKIDEQGYRPATLHELLLWAEKEWNGKDFVVAFGSVWLSPDGHRRVPVLWYGGYGRCLDLYWFENEWNPSYRFLAVRKSPKPLDTLTIEVVIGGKKYKGELTQEK